MQDESPSDSIPLRLTDRFQLSSKKFASQPIIHTISCNLGSQEKLPELSLNDIALSNNEIIPSQITLEYLQSQNENCDLIENEAPPRKVNTKVIVLVFVLCFIGILLLLGGLFINIRFRSFSKGLSFYLIATICIVPGWIFGAYYFIKLLIYWNAKNDQEKAKILNELPIVN